MLLLLAAAGTIAATLPLASSALLQGSRKPQSEGIVAVFEQSRFATYYTVTATDPDRQRVSISFKLVVPKNDPDCKTFAPRRTRKVGAAWTRTAIWYHGDQHGCDHTVEDERGHQGLVVATISDGYKAGDWKCKAVYDGTVTGEGDAFICAKR
jgi:hypothetical protein